MLNYALINKFFFIFNGGGGSYYMFMCVILLDWDCGVLDLLKQGLFIGDNRGWLGANLKKLVKFFFNHV